MEKTCVTCGKVFRARTNGISCSSECKRVYSKARTAAYHVATYKKQSFEKIPCKNCGKVFQPRQRTVFNCSLECSQVYWSNKSYRKQPIEKLCVTCGKTFLPKGSHIVACSPECVAKRKKVIQARYVVIRKSRKPVEKLCVICGDKFNPTNTAITCSPDCSRVLRLSRRIDQYKPRNEKFCVICCASFYPKFPHSLVCSPECRSVMTKENSRSAYKKPRRRAARNAYWIANREKILKARSDFRKINHERIRERERAYDEANRERIKKRMKEWRTANYYHIKEHSHAYHRANLERDRKTSIAYREKEKLCIEIVKKLGLPLPKARDQQRAFSRQLITQHFPEALSTTNPPQKGNNQ